MRRMAAIMISVLVVALAMTGMIACSTQKEPNEPKETNKTMPTMAAIDVNELKSKPISEHQADFEYTFTGKNIAIEDGVVYGLVGGTTTEVTAVSSYGNATFNVNVHSALVGVDGEGSAFALDGKEYIKNGSAYGESACMLNGKLLSGDGLIASGTIAFGSSIDGATASIFLRSEQGKEVSFSAEPTWNGYKVKGTSGNQTREIGSYPQTRINFMVFVSDREAYYYLNDRLVWHAYVQDGAWLGFGGEKAQITISRLSLAYNESLVATLKADARKPFGENMFGVRPNNEFSFVEVGEGVYEKTTDGYHQQWLYHNSDPVSGNNYKVRGYVQMLRPASIGAGEIETVWQSCNSAGQIMRVLLRYDKEQKSYFIFTDYETPNGFYGSRFVKGNVPNEFSFAYEYKNGVTVFYINGEEILRSDSAQIEGLGNLGATHFGFAGQRCQTIISNMTIEVE